MDQDRKRQLAPEIKRICQKYGIKASLGIDNHSTLMLNISSGRIDFANDIVPERDYVNPQKNTYWQVNTYWIHDHWSGKAKEFLIQVKNAMNLGNHDNSDAMTDYFDVGWYISINIGKWNKPYEVIE
ncbi:MAG: hypothetical protein WD512_19590 [Candidatus Paceibacterota bacterium]